MVSRPDKFYYHATVSRHSTLAIDLDITRRLGYDGLEASGEKIRNFLDADHTGADLRALVTGVDVGTVGFLLDIERQGAEIIALTRDAEALFGLANLVGARGVQILTGPVDVRAVTRFRDGVPHDGYSGLLRASEAEQMRLTALNAGRLADMAKAFGLTLYLEALAWTPLNTIDKQLEIIDRAGRDNLKMVIDFWHCYASGDRPDRVARMDGNAIYGVHVCDSLPFAGGIPDESILRDVATGKGILDLQAWVDAVKATGFTGWWSCELFSRRLRQDDSYVVGAELLRLMRTMVLA